MASSLHASFHPDDEDEGKWEPLEPEDSKLGAPVVSVAYHPHWSSPAPSYRRIRIHATGKDDGHDLRIIQRKLEMKRKLKEGLLDHPIDQAWQRFLTHLGRELWELDLCARLGTYLCSQQRCIMFQSLSPFSKASFLDF